MFIYFGDRILGTHAWVERYRASLPASSALYVVSAIAVGAVECPLPFWPVPRATTNDQGRTTAASPALECLFSSESVGYASCACSACRMFRSRRSTLGRRLLRSRVGCAHGNDSGSSADRESEAEADLKAAANSLLTKRLKEKQLELLLEAVESRGGTQTSCVPISKGELKLGRSGRTVAPHVLCCQLFRWPDLKHGNELKRLTFCCESSRQNDEETSGTVCCNPYHISRLCRPGNTHIWC